MARDLRPKHKIIRRFGENILDTQKNPLIQRNYPPGVHGPKGRGRISEYGKQLLEKQKARSMYGILERQFLNYYKRAVAQEGNSAKNFLILLERRLDNAVFRLGFAQTRRQARQMVTHKHITINGKTVNIPSYQIKGNDVIATREKSKKILEARKTAVQKEMPSWISFDEKKLTGRVVSLPDIDLDAQPLHFQSIIEYYSR